MSQVIAKKIVVDPVVRGGVSPGIVTAKSARRELRSNTSYVAKVLANLRDDSNMIYLAARLSNYSNATDARLVSLRQAVAAQDGGAIESLAHALTDSTGKIGALRMMKICIALQMVGRRGMFGKAHELCTELEQEFSRFKENLIADVG